MIIKLWQTISILEKEKFVDAFLNDVYFSNNFYILNTYSSLKLTKKKIPIISSFPMN